MLKSIMDFFATGIYVITLYIFYSVIVFVSTILLGLPIAFAVYYMSKFMSHYFI